MFFVDWFYNLFLWLGFFKKDAKIVILGLGNAGKTTLLHLLVHGAVKAHNPTQRPHNDSFTYGNINFTAYDLGGQSALRNIWKNYTQDPKTIILFMVDSTDPQSIIESKSEIHDLLEDENLKNSAILVLGSKIDAKEAIGRESLIDQLDIRRFGLGLNRPDRPLDCLMFSSLKRVGIKEMVDWLSNCVDIVNANN
ncbi:sarB, Sar1 GTPase [Dictyostelium purpureum]|uniref:SarB, Sar1 GTPase n=1 Tax=Dictyostelium purpureum TaxID=5786 RepID=F1A1V6_DICPU|nr:sarB, Sar1 GTPase [Dictyostelium purpureum]EGC29830.1 sarB, Sar1 GTPase [Dictyostelium purpureum]|eukprot:XP_003293651.1 sarB, Sar1 GTPase [Dictyostelium purpureum]